MRSVVPIGVELDVLVAQHPKVRLGRDILIYTGLSSVATMHFETHTVMLNNKAIGIDMTTRDFTEVIKKQVGYGVVVFVTGSYLIVSPNLNPSCPGSGSIGV